MEHTQYMQRCYDLARLSGREIGTNPKVGAVLVYNDRIIGEGRYQEYGGSHAEVRAIQSVKKEDEHLIAHSTLYVSLEPCCIYGKTPPCTLAIQNAGIQKVHVGTTDPFPNIAGNGIQLLRDSGVEVVLYDAPEAKEIIAPFVTYHIKKRPYITLKFAKSKDNFIGIHDQQVWLSNAQSSRYTHKLRSEMDAILVGTNTAIIDDPSLTTRHYPGDSPLRLVIDINGRIPASHRLLSDELSTVIFTSNKRELPEVKQQILLDNTDHIAVIDTILTYCHTHQIVNLLVEGGSTLFQSFMKADLWDQAVIIQTEKTLHSGIKAPLIHGHLSDTIKLNIDTIQIVKRNP